MRIARVFPRRTKATPDDELTFTDAPDMFARTLGIDEVHVSVTFTYDLDRAHILAGMWQGVAPVRIGGPALGAPGGDFTPGLYLKQGYVITSRGCPNRCWFCSVPKREGELRELPITEGWNVLDDNLLACSESHVRAVFAMLHRVKGHGRVVQFTGGLEAARLKDWHIDLLSKLHPKQMFFAYDTPDDWEPLVESARRLREAGFTRNHLRCYTLIGHPRDTIGGADKRLSDVMALGMFPMAMLWRDGKKDPSREWRRFQKTWARPAIIAGKERAL